MLPTSAFLGLQVRFAHNDVLTVSVFSNADLSFKDYEWMFASCAKVTEKPADEVYFSGGAAYLLSESDFPVRSESHTADTLTEELRSLNAVLNIVLSRSEGDKALVTLQKDQALPLCAAVMLSDSFGGAEITKTESADELTQARLHFRTVSDWLKVRMHEMSAEKAAASPTPLSHYDDMDIVYDLDDEDASASIDELDFSVRASNYLKREGIFTVAKLKVMKQEDLLKICNARKCSDEVLKKLRALKWTSRTEEKDVPVEEPCGREMLDELIGLEGVKKAGQTHRGTCWNEEGHEESGNEDGTDHSEHGVYRKSRNRQNDRCAYHGKDSV